VFQSGCAYVDSRLCWDCSLISTEAIVSDIDVILMSG